MKWERQIYEKWTNNKTKLNEVKKKKLVNNMKEEIKISPK